MTITYEWNYGTFVNENEIYEDLINECSELYSTQYGIWSKYSHYNPGKRIKLSPQKIKEWLNDENASIYWARDGEKLIGYAIAIQLDIVKYGKISWVTQLVVHENYRHKDVAKNLLHSIWGFTDNFAWGIVSANPYAIRALEKTTRRRSSPERIKHTIKKIMSIGEEHIPYINENTEYLVTSETSRINTGFFVDHQNIGQMIDTVVTNTVPWTLGDIEEGWEWIAFTFHDQLPFELSEAEIKNMLNASDQIVMNAYKRMDITPEQKWTQNTEKETDFIINNCGLSIGNTVADFGCGQGRHSLSLAKKGINVTAIDYIDKNINISNKKKKEDCLSNVEFHLGDCRNCTFNSKFDAIICLYDVIGTYSDNNDNQKIIENISNHLKKGGTTIISVMNYHMTEAIAKHKFHLEDSPNELLSLKPSNIMEKSGNIFNPDYFLLDTKTGIVYRREQFKRGRALPVELIVRDKRFRINEIKAMCEQAGLFVEWARFVNAKDWELSLDQTNSSAKEILIKCKKI